MKKITFLVILSFSHFSIVLGQNAVLHISIDNIKRPRCFVSISGEIKNGFSGIVLMSAKATDDTIKLNGPHFVNLTCYDLDNGTKYLTYLFYLSPGDDLALKADFNKPDYGIAVSGRGSNNNQPLMSAMEGIDKERFLRDTLPYRVISAINTARAVRENNLKKYIELYKPSPSYIRDWATSLHYYACDLYYEFKEENRLYVWDAYYRNHDKWQSIADSLFQVAKLNNDSALGAYHYDQLLGSFLEREKEDLSDEEYLHPEVFYREWYHADTVAGKKLYQSDRANLVREMIINKYFTGKTAEYLYAALFSSAAGESRHANIPAIFARFKAKYPNSEYVTQFSGYVDTIITNQKRTLNEKMVIMVNNGTKLNSLDELLAAMKGKTVLVDMWGTWCGPCREEIEKNSAAIREHFKGKGLTYLYIANNDMGNEEQWKKLIAYFNLEGTHLLANKTLTDDIMAKIKGNGFPTIFIIKRNGTFELSKTQSPIDRGILEKQLEDDLAE